MRWPVTLLVVFVACRKPDAPTPLRVAAASDLSRAFEELGRRLEPAPVFTFGSSGLLAKQLAGGAPFDLFAAANRGYVDDAVKAGACDGATARSYARGRLAVWSKAGPVKLDELRDEKHQSIAIANPDHAPYGRAAKEALASAGLWDAVEPRLVLGENIRQTLQLAQTGNVEVAIVALALVMDEPNAVRVDAAAHQPLIQALAVCRNGGNRAGAEAFAKLLESDQGRAVLAKYGFEPP